jgi:hypothetical protein
MRPQFSVDRIGYLPPTDLQHQPRNPPDSPSFFSQRPQGEQDPRETHSSHRHEPDKVRDHGFELLYKSLERLIRILGRTRIRRTEMISTLSLMKKKHSLGKSMLAPMLKRSKARALVSSCLVASPTTLKTR